MGFFRDIFSRGGRVARGQVNKGMDQIEDATFESTVKQTVLDMRSELSKTVSASAGLGVDSGAAGGHLQY